MLSRVSALLRQKSLEASLPCKQGGAQGRTREGFESLPEVLQGSNDNSLSSLKHAGAGDFACESGNCGTFMNRHIINGLCASRSGQTMLPGGSRSCRERTIKIAAHNTQNTHNSAQARSLSFVHCFKSPRMNSNLLRNCVTQEPVSFGGTCTCLRRCKTCKRWTFLNPETI